MTYAYTCVYVCTCVLVEVLVVTVTELWMHCGQQNEMTPLVSGHIHKSLFLEIYTFSFIICTLPFLLYQLFSCNLYLKFTLILFNEKMG